MTTGGTGGTGGGDMVMLSGDIDEDMTFTADNTYLLTDLTFFVNDSILTIEPGTVIMGNVGSALVITRGSQIMAEGTAADPIIFTSSAAEGGRAAGDWGGVVLLGAATINVSGGVEQIEGLVATATDTRGEYGGADDSHDCGTITYARIEFAGFQIAANNELNGLTVGGCGSDTVLDFIQVNRGLDDGVEFFGGTASIKHVVMSGGDDDGLDWDFGWSGNAQFVLVSHPDDTSAENGIEACGNDDEPDATPRSMPTIYNATFVGGNTTDSTQRGMLLRGGSWGVIRNSIITDFGTTAIDVRTAESAAGAVEDPLTLTVENSCFFNNGPDGTTHFEDEPTDGSADDDDAGFVEADFFMDAARNNLFDMDPELDGGFVPSTTGAATSDPAPLPSDAFFDDADYIGAFEPGATPWTDSWTDFAAD